MHGSRESEKFFWHFSPEPVLGVSSAQMTVCSRPNCARDAVGALGFCAADHAAYLRSRKFFAALASAIQIKYPEAFAAVPSAHRQPLAECMVAIASEGLPPLPANVDRSAALLAAALIAHGPERIAPAPTSARRLRPGSPTCRQLEVRG